jgi:hypothetical protein
MPDVQQLDQLRIPIYSVVHVEGGMEKSARARRLRFHRWAHKRELGRHFDVV